MEWAIFISKVADLKYWNQKYSRIYFGNEFCQRLLPSVKKLEEVLNFASTRNLNLSFVSPYVTDRGLEDLRPLLEILSHSKPESEVIINDWGVLRTNSDYGLKPVLGRLLTKQIRDPMIVSLKASLTGAILHYLKEASLNLPFVQFLKDRNIKRVELDNLLQGIRIDKAGSNNLTFSLYFPFGYVTTTRLCPMNVANRVAGKTFGIYPCQRECQKSSLILTHPSMPLPLTLKGNAIFFENKRMPQEMVKMGISRIVYQPTIPI